MSNLGPQQQNVSYEGILQVPGGVTAQLQQVQDGEGRGTGLFVSSTGATTATADSFVVSIDGTAVTGAIPRLISDGFGDYISVKDFGAVGDGVTNDRNALQTAITYATAHNVRLYIPAGTYYVPNNATTLSFSGNLSMFGAGMDRSILYYNDNVSSSRRDFFTSTAAGNLDFCDLAFQSTWGTDGDYSQRSQLTEINTGDTSAAGINRAIVTRCKFSYSRNMSLVLTGFYEVTVANCVFQNGVADGCRVINSASVTVSDNYFNQINDDSIAVHSNISAPAPAKTTVVIADNKIVDGQGIACLGPKDITVTGNSLTRVQTRGIFIGKSTLTGTEGKTSVVALTITGNTITDVFKGSVFYAGSGDNGGYIQVAGLNLNNIGNGYVGGTDGSGAVLQPWTYLSQTDASASTQNPGNYFVNITGNVCARTLYPTAAYSNYGFGERLGRGGPVDPAIGETSFDGGGNIIITGAVQGLNIAGNIISGAYTYGIWFIADGSLPVATYRDVNISGNTFTNIVSTRPGTTSRAIQMSYGRGSVHIAGNTFDLDPYCISTYRVAGGKWDTSYVDLSAAITCGEVTPIIENNTFKNMGSIHGGGYPATWYWSNNTIICNPVAYGLNANNVGIGNIGSPNLYGAAYVIEDGDPSSATYGLVINTCPLSASTMPTYGKYVQGTIVKHTIPYIAGTGASRYIVLGWDRLTTGSSHVLNTDWAEIKTLVDTYAYGSYASYVATPTLTWIAHRGGAGMAPEDTMSAFSNAIALGSPILECDVQISLDNIPVIIHDSTVDRTTNGTGAVKDLLYYGYMDTLDAGSFYNAKFNNSYIPTLDEYFALCKAHNVLAMPEIKGYKTQSDIQYMLNSMYANDCQPITCWQSFNFSDLQYVRARDATVSLSYLYTPTTQAQLNSAIASLVALGGPVELSCSYSTVLANPSITWAHSTTSAGVKLSVWTVDTPYIAKQLMDMGVNRIMSNYYLGGVI